MHKPLSWKASFFVAACIMAFAAGVERADEQRTRTVPTTQIDPNVARICTEGGNGGIASVTEHPAEPGVFHVRCRNGIVLVAGER